MIESFQTISSKVDGEYKEKGSKFFAYAHPVKTEEEVRKLVKWYRKEYYDARHHCYAYVLGADARRTRAADDGEPSNSAGAPILGQIKSKQLTNVFVMVVRYFGGTKLGIPGMINAYRSAAEDALYQAKIVTDFPTTERTLSFNYEKMNVLMKVVKDFDLEIVSQDFQLECVMVLSIKDKVIAAVDALLENYYVKE